MFDFTMTETSELIERRSQIGIECDTATGEALVKLEEELNAINEELESRKAAEDKRREIREAVAAGAGSIIETIDTKEERKEDRSMTVEEIRNTPDYIRAFANYIKTGDPAECRALITENSSGTIAVPTIVYETVKTAWERNGIMRLVRKEYLKGNLSIGFEISSSEAVEHTEGESVDEESLVLGIVKLVPVAIKKWISISDEALDMAPEAYLRYIYDELTYRIAKKAAKTLIQKIIAAPAVSTTTAVGVPVYTATTISLGLIAQAMSNLSDEAADPVVIMNRKTWGLFKAAQAAGNFGYDPFEGLDVVFDNSITAFSAATTGVTYAIVGDLGQGALANFPNGEEITVKRDDYTLAASDLVRFIGREYAAVGVVGPESFVKIVH